jgi:hypothetical protein
MYFCRTEGMPARTACSVTCGPGMLFLVTRCTDLAGVYQDDSLCGGCQPEPTATPCFAAPCEPRRRRAVAPNCLFRLGIYRGKDICPPSGYPDAFETLPIIPLDSTASGKPVCIPSLLFASVPGLYEIWTKKEGLGAKVTATVYSDAGCTQLAEPSVSPNTGSVFTIREATCNSKDSGNFNSPRFAFVQCHRWRHHRLHVNAGFGASVLCFVCGSVWELLGGLEDSSSVPDTAVLDYTEGLHMRSPDVTARQLYRQLSRQLRRYVPQPPTVAQLECSATNEGVVLCAAELNPSTPCLDQTSTPCLDQTSTPCLDQTSTPCIERTSQPAPPAMQCHAAWHRQICIPPERPLSRRTSMGAVYPQHALRWRSVAQRR